ncbi:hypothetical protein GLOTRDRAFT_134429 [Gloeophyllum trabeum ATCC 11539]|uniref:Uncharacterized protein n=1 Tax=Gloeophyllum trabeum (strain ATCC 11539 / FP-39264 / Madison 617) TaxID=670483 RepID=S7PPV4_GLOTA|nr:uncharacterized protein GLOTRDRAFT_134429 [Gloeophyllum trabeum ATCC 11539]EPQ49936.1 hypothetical protein GLOTRDRAFT_134429 [Gloeophyllum trabeum ATCC 11539]
MFCGLPAHLPLDTLAPAPEGPETPNRDRPQLAVWTAAAGSVVAVALPAGVLHADAKTPRPASTAGVSGLQKWLECDAVRVFAVRRVHIILLICFWPSPHLATHPCLAGPGKRASSRVLTGPYSYHSHPPSPATIPFCERWLRREPSVTAADLVHHADVERARTA